MRTEDDLRDALQLFSDAAGPTQLEPKKYRPRRTVVLVAVAATVAAAIAIPLAVKGHNTPPPVDSESGRRTPFKVNLPTGWQQVTTTMAAKNA